MTSNFLIIHLFPNRMGQIDVFKDENSLKLDVILFDL